MRLRFAVLSLAVMLVAAPVFACDDHGDEKPAQSIGIISLDQLRELWKTKGVVILDVSDQETRSRFGQIPHARLLTSSSDFEVAKELPEKKTTPLVFYCADAQCSSSDQAAERALSAGYSQVSVLREGLAGWRAAGNPVQSLKPSSRTSPRKGARGV